MQGTFSPMRITGEHDEEKRNYHNVNFYPGVNIADGVLDLYGAIDQVSSWSRNEMEMQGALAEERYVQRKDTGIFRNCHVEIGSAAMVFGIINLPELPTEGCAVERPPTPIFLENVIIQDLTPRLTDSRTDSRVLIKKRTIGIFNGEGLPWNHCPMSATVWLCHHTASRCTRSLFRG